MLYALAYLLNKCKLPSCLIGLPETSIYFMKQDFVNKEKRAYMILCAALEILFGLLFIGFQVGAMIEEAPLYQIMSG